MIECVYKEDEDRVVIRESRNSDEKYNEVQDVSVLLLLQSSFSIYSFIYCVCVYVCLCK